MRRLLLISALYCCGAPVLCRIVTVIAAMAASERQLRVRKRFATGAFIPVGACAAMAELVDAQR